MLLILEICVSQNVADSALQLTPVGRNKEPEHDYEKVMFLQICAFLVKALPLLLLFFLSKHRISGQQSAMSRNKGYATPKKAKVKKHKNLLYYFHNLWQTLRYQLTRGHCIYLPVPLETRPPCRRGYLTNAKLQQPFTRHKQNLFQCLLDRENRTPVLPF